MLTANLAENIYATRFDKTTNEDMAVKYERTLPFYYKAGSDGESVVVLSFTGALRITQIERNTKPMEESEYGFNANTSTLSLVNPLGAGEELFGLYAVLITS